MTFQMQHRCFAVCGLGTSQTLTGHHQPGGNVPSGIHVWMPVFLPMHEAWDSSRNKLSQSYARYHCSTHFSVRFQVQETFQEKTKKLNLKDYSWGKDGKDSL